MRRPILLRQIYEEQYPRFDGPVAADRHVFASPEEAAGVIMAESPPPVDPVPEAKRHAYPKRQR
jgi:hypothetical protein